MIDSPVTIESAIESAACRLLGCAAARVARHRSVGELDSGAWFNLFVYENESWQLLGRRRTCGELHDLIRCAAARRTHARLRAETERNPTNANWRHY
jgi:hypothetical protein